MVEQAAEGQAAGQSLHLVAVDTRAETACEHDEEGFGPCLELTFDEVAHASQLLDHPLGAKRRQPVVQHDAGHLTEAAGTGDGRVGGHLAG